MRKLIRIRFGGHDYTVGGLCPKPIKEGSTKDEKVAGLSVEAGVAIVRFAKGDLVGTGVGAAILHWKPEIPPKKKK